MRSRNPERMSSYARWALEPGGRVDASNQLQMRTNQSTYDYSNRARERQTEQQTRRQPDNFKNERLLFLYDVPSAMRCRVAPVHFSRVCAERITGLFAGVCRPLQRIITAKNVWIVEASHQRFLNANCRY